MGSQSIIWYGNGIEVGGLNLPIFDEIYNADDKDRFIEVFLKYTQEQYENIAKFNDEFLSNYSFFEEIGRDLKEKDLSSLNFAINYLDLKGVGNEKFYSKMNLNPSKVLILNNTYFYHQLRLKNTFYPLDLISVKLLGLNFIDVALKITIPFEKNLNLFETLLNDLIAQNIPFHVKVGLGMISETLKYNIIILSSSMKLPPFLEKNLLQFVKNGGVLIICDDFSNQSMNLKVIGAFLKKSYIDYSWSGNLALKTYIIGKGKVFTFDIIKPKFDLKGVGLLKTILTHNGMTSQDLSLEGASFIDEIKKTLKQLGFNQRIDAEKFKEVMIESYKHWKKSKTIEDLLSFVQERLIK